MLSANFNIEVEKILKAEGSRFQNDPIDNGNYYQGKLIGSKYGITPAFYYAAFKEVPTADTIRNLTANEAKQAYTINLSNVIRYPEIKNQSVASLMMNYLVNSGIGTISELKRIANVTNGKKIFAETDTPFTATEISLLNKLPQSIYFKNLKTNRARMYKDIVARDPVKQKYLKGWLDRLERDHSYSGKISFNWKPWAIGGAALLVAGGALYYYRTRSGRARSLVPSI